ncbi:MAG: hypothetical protein ACKV2O_00345 [Acidimicrobiales bacterium]
MDRALWPSSIPELFRVAASALAGSDTADGSPLGGPPRAGEDGSIEALGAALRALTEGERGAEQRSDDHSPAGGAIAEQLRRSLGVPQFLSLSDDALVEAVRTVRGEIDMSDLVALTVVQVIGRQLLHQYPMSSLIWDGVNDEVTDVFGDAELLRVAPGVWNRQVGDRPMAVIQMIEDVLPYPDVRRFTLHWGLTLPAVPFCRHATGPNGELPVHQLSCCAVSGDLGSVRPPFGSHRFVVTLGMVLEQRSSRPARLVGREGFRARLHRLVNFCERMAEREQLRELLVDHPWRNGIGIAEQLRNADAERLDQLLR